jgi:hypothetical protein
MVVVQPVNNAVVRIEFWDQLIEKTAILMLISAPSGPSDQIRQLDHARRLRVDKKGHLGEIPKVTPPSAVDAEMPGQRLEFALMTGLIHDDESLLTVIRVVFVEPLKKEVKPTGNVLECHFYWVARGIPALIDYRRKEFQLRFAASDRA